MARGLKKFAIHRALDDCIGTIASYFFSLIKRRRKLPKIIKKICVIKLSGIGDAILTLPLLKKLKEKRKEVLVIAAKENFIVYKNQPFINEVILFDIKRLNFFRIFRFILKIKKRNIDVVIDTSQTANFSAILSFLISKFCIGFANPKTPARNKLYDVVIKQNPSKHMVFNFLNLGKPIGIKYNSKEINLIKLPFSKKDNKKIASMLRKSKNLVGLHPCSIFDYREWPKENWVKIIEYLIDRYNVNIVIVGSKEESLKVSQLIEGIKEEYRRKIINLAGKLELNELFALMPKLKLFIANDGGPMHVAAAQGIPVIGLFGTDTPLRYAPFNHKSLAIYANLPNHPCIKPWIKEFKPCGKCLKAIKVEKVKEAIDRIFKKANLKTLK